MKPANHYQFASEFGEDFAPPAEVLALVNSGMLRDTAWHNDIAPSFRVGTSPYVLWCDAADVSLRELTEGRRFWFTHDNENHPTLETDDAAVVIAEVQRILAKPFACMVRLAPDEAMKNADIACNYCDGIDPRTVAFHLCAATGHFVEETRGHWFYAAIDCYDGEFETLEDAVQWLKGKWIAMYPHLAHKVS